MISYHKYTLDNGLVLLVHEDESTSLAAVNLLYKVGSRDEDHQHTGLAHLFEHLMFEGSQHVGNFDYHSQLAGGSNNAFTSSDITNYYQVLPANNLDTALWMESDRMKHLCLNDKVLEVQKKVVSEEFKEYYVNEPYGDAYHHLFAQAYPNHPYKWLTIGKNLEHIEQVDVELAKAFYAKHYAPNNAILVVAGGVKKEDVLDRVQHWFNTIASSDHSPYMPLLNHGVTDITLHLTDEVEVDALYKAYPMCDQLHPDYVPLDVLTDILSDGESSRLYEELVQEQELFSDISAYITGTADPGLLLIEGKLSDGVSLDEANQAVEQVVRALAQKAIDKEELQKTIHRSVYLLSLAETNVVEKAMTLAYFEFLGSADLANDRMEQYQSVQAKDIQRVAQRLFVVGPCINLYYHAIHE